MLYPSTDALADRVRSDAALPESRREGHGPRHVIVVADRFGQFADGQQVLTLSDLAATASDERASAAGCEWVLHVGQGIERSELDALLAADVVNSGPGMRLADPESLLRRPVPPATVHKHRAENVLLADLRDLSEARCSADLRIHRDNELVLDHHTGQHVPGMVVIEAMRQICTAQFETSYRSDLPSHDYAGVWHRINLSFENFLFALRAEVFSEVTEAELGRKANLWFCATTSVRQNGEVVASAEIEYSMVRQERMDVLERRKAARAARAQLVGFPR